MTTRFDRQAHRLNQQQNVVVPPLISSSLPAHVGLLTRWREVNDLAKLYAFARREEGQTMAEYGVVLAVITLGVVVALTALSGGISNAINNVTGFL